MKYVVLHTCDKTVGCLFAETKCTAYGSLFSLGTLMYKNVNFVRRHHGASYPAKQGPLARNLYVDGWPSKD